MDNLFQFIHPKQLFAPPQRQRKKLHKSRFVPVTPPETPTTSSVDSAEMAHTDGGIDLLETVQVPVNSLELINTLHVPKTSTVTPFTRRKKSAQQDETVNASVAPGGVSTSSERESYTSSLKPVMNRRQKITYLLLLGLWLGSVIFFWSWWLRPE